MGCRCGATLITTIKFDTAVSQTKTGERVDGEAEGDANSDFVNVEGLEEEEDDSTFPVD